MNLYEKGRFWQNFYIHVLFESHIICSKEFVCNLYDIACSVFCVNDVVLKVKCSGSKCLCNIGAKLWNTLPANISDFGKFQSFKVAIKSHFIKGLSF